MTNRTTAKANWAIWTLISYLIVVAVVTLAPPPFSMSNGGSGINFVPLLPSVQCFVPTPGQPSTTEFCVRTIAGNFAMFVPLGLLLPIVFGKHTSPLRVFFVALVTSSTIEALQYAGSRLGSGRWSDVDDILFNILGALAGYLLYYMGQREARRS